MLFNSFPFIFAFLPLTLMVFFWLAHQNHFTYAISFLILASLFFYGYMNPVYILLILGSVLFNYGVGKSLERNNRRSIFILGIAFNVALLAGYKYTDFAITNLVEFFLEESRYFFLEPPHKVVLPLAISFFTFQQIAYLVDIHKLRVKSEPFLKYCLFITFFPQLIAGPICRHNDILPQFRDTKWFRLNWDNLAVGGTIFCIGLFKKTVIADGIGKYANSFFNTLFLHPEPGLFEAWGGTLAFTFQIYFDFSGYSDMAIGLARMFNVRLPLNFFSPYKALSIVEFWRTWHITLSHFLRDFLYIPLGGNRKGNTATLRNLLVTMLLGGLWHGAGWHFIAWGGLHGVYLAINHQWTTLTNSRASLGKLMDRGASRFASWLLTFLAVTLAWVLFRANNLEDAVKVYRGLTGMNGVSIPEPIANALGSFKARLADWGVRFPLDGARPMTYTVVWILLIAPLTWIAPNLYQVLERHQPGLDYPSHTTKEADQFHPHFSLPRLQWKPSTAWAMGITCLASLGILAISSAEEFIYFEF